MAMRFPGRTRRRPSRRRRRPPAAPVKQRFPATYHIQIQDDLTGFDSLADDSIVNTVILDNSVDFGGNVVKIRKAVFRWGLTLQQAGNTVLLAAVVRHTQGSPPTAYTETTIRDLRNENHLLRGPWLLVLGSQQPTSVLENMKPIILKNLILDQNDDVTLALQNVGGAALTAAGPHLHWMMTAWYRVIS